MAIANAVNGWRNFIASGSPNGSQAGLLGDQYFDSQNFILYVCVIAGTSTGAIWAQQLANNLTSLPTSVTPHNFLDVTTTTQTMVQNTFYTADANNALTTFTLPATIAKGAMLQVTQNAFGSSTGWKIAQLAGQQIFYGVKPTTAGVNGYLNSTAVGNSVTLICVIANSSFLVTASQGNINVN